MYTHHNKNGSTYSVEIRTAGGIIRVPCETLDEAQEIRESVFDAGLSCLIKGLPSYHAYAGFGAVDDVAVLPEVED